MGTEDGAPAPNRIMSGWHSLHSVGTFHVLLQAFGMLIAAAVIAAGVTAYHFWNRWDELVSIAERLRAQYLPRWRPDMGLTLHNGFVGIALLGPFVLLATAYAASAWHSWRRAASAASTCARSCQSFPRFQVKSS